MIYEVAYPPSPGSVVIKLKDVHDHLPTPELTIVCRQLHLEASGYYNDAILAFWRTHVFRLELAHTPRPLDRLALLHALGRRLRAKRDLRRVIAAEGGTRELISDGFRGIRFRSKMPRVSKLDEMLRTVASIDAEADE